MRTAIHNVEPKTSAERVAVLNAQIDRLAAVIRDGLGGAPAKPKPIGNRYLAPPGDDEGTPITNSLKIEQRDGHSGVRVGRYLAPAGE